MRRERVASLNIEHPTPNIERRSEEEEEEEKE
jgi:hypothetical protein